MKQHFYKPWSRPLLITLLSLLMAVGGSSPVWAEEYSTSFEASEGWEKNYDDQITKEPEGWSFKGTLTTFTLSTSRKKTGSNGLYCSASNSSNYIITPKLAKGTISFWASANTAKSYKAQFFKCTKESEESFTIESSPLWSRTSMTPQSLSTTMAQYSFELDEDSYIAILLSSQAGIDDFTAANGLASDVVDGPALTIKDGSTKITSGYSYSFGLATAGSSHTFTLSNPGTEAVEGLAVTNKFGATLSATTIAAGGEVTLTVTMPDATSSEAITISSSTEGIDDFTINVSGTVRDASKLWCNFSEGVPTGWTNSGNYTITTSGAGDGTSGGGYAGETSYSYKLMYTPFVTIADGEKLYLQVAGYGSTASWNEMQIRYSADGSIWTTAKTVSNIVKGSWTSVEVTEIPAGNWYIGFYGRYVYFTDIYGGTESTAPVIALSQSSYDFGLISANSTSSDIRNQSEVIA